jgi:hypothetical protein
MLAHLQMGHQMGAISLDLLIRGYSTKNNFREPSAFEWTIGDSTAHMSVLPGTSRRSKQDDVPNNLQWVLHYGHGQVCSVIHKPCDVVFRHLWQLFLEYTFKAGEDNEALAGSVIIDDAEFYFAGAFF